VNYMDVNYIDHMGTDLTVCNAARVSFDKHHDALSGGDEKLIGYLAKHDHWTPFSHCTATFRIKAPIFVARQLFKHKVGLTENEISRRYVDSKPEFYSPSVWRKRPTDKKQGSGDNFTNQDAINCANEISYSACISALESYNSLLANGISPEQARMVLPQSMYTSWYWTGSMSSFARICKLRISDDAQAESRGIAEMIDKECNKLWPISWSALHGT